MIKKPSHINKPQFQGIKMAYGIRVINSLFRRSLDAKRWGYFSLIALYYGKIETNVVLLPFVQINYVPFQQIFYSCSTIGTEAHLQGCFAISCVVSENKILYPISTDFFTYFPPQEQKCTSRDALYPSSYARRNSIVWSAALDGVTVPGNSPISSKY